MHCRDWEDVASMDKLRRKTAGTGGTVLDAEKLFTTDSDLMLD